MGMQFYVLFFGLTFVALGLIIKSAPNLISGYNTLTEKEKANVDIDGLTSLFRKGFIIIGLLIVIGYYLFTWLGITTLAQSMMFAPIMIGILILLVKAKKYDRNPKKLKSNIGIAVIAVASLLIFTIIPYSYLPTKIEVNQNEVSFSGVYHITIQASDIAEVALLDSIPAITAKINGFGFSDVSKGYFRLVDYGKCRLFLHGHTAPFLMIVTKNGERTIFCNPDKSLTESYYNKINKLLKIEK